MDNVRMVLNLIEVRSSSSDENKEILQSVIEAMRARFTPEEDYMFTKIAVNEAEEKMLDEMRGYKYSWFDTPYSMKGHTHIDDTSRVIAYKPFVKQEDLKAWFDENEKIVIESHRDCSGEWFSFIQYIDDVSGIIYDYQLVDC